MRSGFTLLAFLFFFAARAQVAGCTDPLALNYNPMATVNDGSCTYPATSVAPASSVNLPEEVDETSGLIKDATGLYTHNDSNDTNLYKIDSIAGSVLQTLPVTGAMNQDWEDIAADEDFYYIGDFGNNANGNRVNLKVLKVSKEAFTTEAVNFSYSNQADFNPAGGNNTDFDCETLIVGQDSIYLFTKQWVSGQTSIYALPKTAGTYTANYKTTYNVNGLITGAAYDEERRVVVLCGYSTVLQPFFYLLYDFNGHDFFSGNKRKITVPLGFHQIEGVTAASGYDYFATNERFMQGPFVTQQKLHRFNLAPYLENYFENIALSAGQHELRAKIRVYPNPAGDTLYIEIDPSLINTGYAFYDAGGRQAKTGILQQERNVLDISVLASGLYTIKINEFPDYAYRLVKR